MALTSKQTAFVAEYLIDLNATAVARRAGSKGNNLDSVGAPLVRNNQVRLVLPPQAFGKPLAEASFLAKPSARSDSWANRALVTAARPWPTTRSWPHLPCARRGSPALGAGLLTPPSSRPQVSRQRSIPPCRYLRLLLR
jgi:hypothetical protein